MSLVPAVLLGWLLTVSAGTASSLISLAGIILVALLAVWYGLPAATAAAVILVVAILVYSGHPYLAVHWGIRVGATGAIYGYFLRQKLAVSRTVAAGLASTLLAILAAGPVFGQIWASWRADVLASIEPTWQLYQQNGFLETAQEYGVAAETLRWSLETVAGLMADLGPAFTILELAFLAIVAYFLARWLVGRLGSGRGELPPVPPFPRWRVPWYFGWLIIAGLTMALLGDYYGLDKLSLWGINIILLYLVLAAVIGLAVGISYYLYLPWPLLLKNLLLLIVIIYLPLALLVLVAIVVLGIFDPLVDFRRWIKEET